MKKLLGCFFCVMLLFGLSAPVAADMLVWDVDPPTTGAYWTGDDTNGINLNNSGEPAEEAWVYALTNTVVELTPLGLPGDGTAIPGYTNSIAVLKYGEGTGGAYDLYGFKWWAIQDDGDGILELYDVVNPYYSISGNALEGIGTFNGSDYVFDLGEKALSHVDAAVPEPTTMLLLGAGLVGLAGFGRKRFKK